MVAVVASMLVSANVSFAGFGVPGVPGAGKPAASSSAKVDVKGLVERNLPILALLTTAENCAAKAVIVVADAIDGGKIDKKLLADYNAMNKKPSASSASKVSKSIVTTINSMDLAKVKADKEVLYKAITKSKAYQHAAYAAMTAAAVPAVGLLKDASDAIKNLSKDPANFGKVKGIVDTCVLAGKILGDTQKQMKALNDKIKTVREFASAADRKPSKEEQKAALEENKVAGVKLDDAFAQLQ